MAYPGNNNSNSNSNNNNNNQSMGIWFPEKINDLDLFSHKVLQYPGEELDSEHPGFTDEEYRKRRLYISTIAKNYKQLRTFPHKSTAFFSININSKLTPP
jgi:phenylalanine-4-hydroxylase